MTSIEMIDRMAQGINDLARGKGWWDTDHGLTTDAEKIALIHSELSEALEGLRKGNPADEHCPEYTSVEIELADAVIRILDLSAQRGYRLGEAIEAKHAYNASRPIRHGKRF